MEEESKPKDFKFLVLSLYYYLKKNNFSETAEQLKNANLMKYLNFLKICLKQKLKKKN